MARGKPLTNTEKWAIKGMLESGYSIGKIATQMARSDSAIRTYIETELSEFKEQVDVDSGFLPKDVEKAVYDQLIEQGMEKIDAISSLHRIKVKLQETATMDHVGYIVGQCLGKVNLRKMFTTQGEGGRKGIAVMTAATSQQLDKIKENRKTNKNVDDHIFKQEHAIPKGLE